MMRRIAFSCAATFLVTVFPLLIAAQQQPQQQPVRPVSPRLSNEDLLSPRVTNLPVESDAQPTVTSKTGAPVRNPRSVLENALLKMTGVRSLRTTLQMTSSTGAREVVVETVKPDRMRVTAPAGEIVVIGQAYYYRPAGGSWQVTNSRSALSTSGSALNYTAIVKEMLSATGVSITGRVLGEEAIDGAETVAYEFTVTDGAETGTIAASIGKSDGFLRRLFMSGSAITLKAWFTSINENFTIDSLRCSELKIAVFRAALLKMRGPLLYALPQLFPGRSHQAFKPPGGARFRERANGSCCSLTIAAGRCASDYDVEWGARRAVLVNELL